MNSSVAFCPSAAFSEEAAVLHDHAVLGAERAARLQLGEPLHLDEAHATGPDGRAEARLVAEDRDLDARRRSRLDEAGALRHLDLAVVDRYLDEVRHAGTGALVVDVHGNRRKQVVEGRGAVERAAALVDVRLELVPELVEVAHHGDRVGVAERAQALAVDALGHGDEQVHVGLRAAAVLDLLEDLGRPLRPDTARRALPARLVLVELRHPHGELHHAAAVVDHDHGRRADGRPGSDERVEVERHASRLVGREDTVEEPPGMTAFSSRPPATPPPMTSMSSRSGKPWGSS